ncbi:nuclear movement protein nudc [Planoprotostelium fungivorum]|uniref:Nuclear movement protein nudc n=1 Tax=Planoprotostelium fungivorum TaxID=1890364 RepID=A0A2P6MTT6_9EUKA|nr:nuclear movement protein nudc [Planoprotostelium fungivorum]
MPSQQSKWVKYGGDAPGYKWWQTETEVTFTVPVGAVKGRDIAYNLKPGHLQVGVKGQPLIVDGELFASVLPDGSSWILDNGNVEITLEKSTSGPTWWASAIKGHPKIDVERIEASKHLDDSLLQKLAERDEEKLREKAAAEKAAAEGKTDAAGTEAKTEA